MRNFSCLIITSACLWLFCLCEVAVAEQRLVAVIMTNSQPRYQEVHSAFVEHSSSFCETDCKLYVQTPNADTMSLRNAVRKAVALGSDMIVTYGPLATLAAQAERPPMPTLFADVYDPVGLGLVSSTSHTGRQMTGVRGDAPVQALIKYLGESVELRRLAVLYDIHSPEGNLQKDVIEKSAQRKGYQVIAVGVGEDKDHLVPLKSMPKDVDAIFAASSEHHETQLSYVMGYASANEIPVITQRAKAAEQGAFMALETSAKEQGTRLAQMASQVFSGTDVGTIKLAIPREVAFVINLKVASELGFKVPIQTLSVASRVVR